MTERNVVLSTVFIVLAAAGSTAAQSVIEQEKFDVEKARVYMATVQPHRPVLAPNGHARNRVFIYMDDGVMTRREGNTPATTTVFHRGDVGWIPASTGYVSENTTDRPVRILMVDLKGTASGPTPVTKFDPAVVDPRHYTVVLENDQVRVLRIHFEPGTRYAYSGEGLILLQFVIENGRRTQGLGLDVGDLAKANFDRLRMTRTSLVWPQRR